MSLAPRILAAAGLLAVPALLAVGSQALSRPADVPLRERQTVVVDLAPAGTTDPAPAGADGDPAEPSPAEPSTSPERIPEPASGTPGPVPAPVVPAPLAPADQGTPGLVERGILGDTDDDGRDDASDDASDDADSDDDSVVPDGED